MYSMAQGQTGEGTREGLGDGTACLVSIRVCYPCISSALLVETDLYCSCSSEFLCNTRVFIRVAWTRLASMMNTRNTYLFSDVAGGEGSRNLDCAGKCAIRRMVCKHVQCSSSEVVAGM